MDATVSTTFRANCSPLTRVRRRCVGSWRRSERRPARGAPERRMRLTPDQRPHPRLRAHFTRSLMTSLDTLACGSGRMVRQFATARREDRTTRNPHAEIVECDRGSRGISPSARLVSRTLVLAISFRRSPGRYPIRWRGGDRFRASRTGCVIAEAQVRNNDPTAGRPPRHRAWWPVFDPTDTAKGRRPRRAR